MPLLALALAAGLGACASTVADLPPEVGGLPAGTPQRSAQPQAYPAVHDMPPPRPNTVLTEEERKKAAADLAALRERQEKQAAAAARGSRGTIICPGGGAGVEQSAPPCYKAAAPPQPEPRVGAPPHGKRDCWTMEEFHRIRRLPPYVFEQVNRAKAAARNAGADIIDLGMGNPDLPAPPHVVEKLQARRWASRAPTAIRPRKASRACAAPRPPTTRAGSG